MPFQIAAFWNGVLHVKTTPLAFDLINATTVVDKSQTYTPILYCKIPI